MLYLLARLLALPQLRNHSLDPSLLLPLGLRPKLQVRGFNFVAVGVHALPQIEYFRLAVEIKMQLVFDEQALAVSLFGAMMTASSAYRL